MKNLLLPFLLSTALAVSAAAADSYVYINDGKSITNGARVDVKTIKKTYAGSFFWFTINGRAYITRDAKTLHRIKDVYAPLFSTESSIDEANRRIEIQLHDISTQIVRQKLAVAVK